MIIDPREQPELEGAPPPPPPPASPQAIIRRSEGIEWVQIGAEVVIYQPRRATSYVLNPIAALVWQCLDGTSSLAEILTDVAEAFAVEREQVFDDFLPSAGVWLANGVADSLDAAYDVVSERPNPFEPYPDGFRRLDPPLNFCGKAEAARWPNRATLGLGGTAVTVASDDPHVIDELRPWRVDLDTDLVDYVVELDPPPSPTRRGARRLPSISNGCEPLFKLRDPSLVRAVLWRVLASHAAPAPPGSLRVRLMPITDGRRALLVPPGHGGALSHRWYEARGLQPLYTVSSLIDVDTAHVVMDEPLDTDSRRPADPPTPYPLLGWWLPTVDPTVGLTPGEAVAHLVRWTIGIDADNAGQSLTGLAGLVERVAPELAPVAPDWFVEQVSPPQAAAMRNELASAIAARFET